MISAEIRGLTPGFSELNSKTQWQTNTFHEVYKFMTFSFWPSQYRMPLFLTTNFSRTTV
jgi:hypothetical protein